MRLIVGSKSRVTCIERINLLVARHDHNGPVLQNPHKTLQALWIDSENHMRILIAGSRYNVFQANFASAECVPLHFVRQNPCSLTNCRQSSVYLYPFAIQQVEAVVFRRIGTFAGKYKLRRGQCVIIQIFKRWVRDRKNQQCFLQLCIGGRIHGASSFQFIPNGQANRDGLHVFLQGNKVSIYTI